MRLRNMAGLLVAPLLSGCTVIGFGIGAAVPAYETQGHGEVDASKLSAGDKVRIVATSKSGEGMRRIAGTYRGFDDDAILVDTWASVKRGNRAGEGALIGLVADALIVMTAVAAHGWTQYR